MTRWLAAAIALTTVTAGAAAARGPVGWHWTLPAGVEAPPVPADNPMSAAKVALGRRLFYDADLSINGTLSCATCHEQRHSFSDGVSAHPGAHGEPGLRNVPSLVNVAWTKPLTWGNPALTTLEAQAIVPVTGDDPVEMGMKGHEAEIAARLGANPCYRKLFRAAFPQTHGRIDLPSSLQAVAAFERTIVSFDSAWDHARNGRATLPPDAARGEALFRGSAGCAGCHAGIDFSDHRFHRTGGTGQDSGVQRATGKAADAGRFRTPSLRNVALTAPYLHDGSAATLAEAIDRHAGVPPADLPALAAFLDTLTDRAVTTDPRLALPGKACSRAF